MDVSVALEKACYFPGELLKCLVKVRRVPDASPPPPPPAAAAGEQAQQQQQLQLFFECSGSERVDPSWVGQLCHPEVTAQKDNKRLVRSIFSTGEVPLLEGSSQALGSSSSSSGREFIVRCRLPSRIPPSYRGSAVRFVYQVAVRASLATDGPGTSTAAAPPAKQAQQQQQPGHSCQAHASFVVWPLSDRAGTLDRRVSLPSGVNVTAAAGPLPSAAPQQQQQQQPPAAGGLLDGLAEVESIEYKLGMQALKLRWEEVIVNPDGTRTLLTHSPAANTLYPAAAGKQLSGALTAAQLCALDSLQLSEQRPLDRAAARGPGRAAAATGGGEDGDGERGGALRHLTPAQRASMALRTFNLRAGDFPLLRLVLQPPTDGLLQPGGTFGLLLDFRASHGAVAAAAAAGDTSLQPVCLQVVALLESEEVVLPPHAPARAPGGLTTSRKLHAEQQQLTAHLLAAHFTFTIPLTAAPSFRSPMVGHKWLLRFELTLGRPRPQRPAELVPEQLLWALPLVVSAPPPTAAVLG